MTDHRKDAARANRSGEATYRPVQQSIARTIVDAETCSLKRLAWAYGCAPKGSSEEKQLEMLLLGRAEPELNELAASWASIASEAIVAGEAHRLENDTLRAEVRELRADRDELTGP